MLHIDLDDFKAINDTWGHSAGDAVLKHAAAALQKEAGKTGFSARLGGDEFVLITPVRKSATETLDFAKQLVSRISEPIRFEGQVLQVAASVGIVAIREFDSLTPDELLNHSDIALYEAKRTQRKCVLLSSEMLDRHNARAALILEIKQGLQERQFVPFFQPKVDTRNHVVVGVEVLARWQHPVRGLLLPAEFMDEAESANLMGEIERSIIGTALSAYRGWLDKGDTVGRLSINLTAANLYSLAFVEFLQMELSRSGLTSRDIELELLESIIFESADTSLFGRCRQLRDEGFHLTLDDFGTGYASISSLIDNTIETIKIDRSFVKGINSDERLQRITRSILALSQQLGLNVIAEGVETAKELEVLNAFGCDVIQGHIFGLPLGQEDMSQWLSEMRQDKLGLQHVRHA